MRKHLHVERRYGNLYKPIININLTRNTQDKLKLIIFYYLIVLSETTGSADSDGRACESRFPTQGPIST